MMRPLMQLGETNMRALWMNIGAALVACQPAERLINVSLKSPFPKEPIRTVEMLDRLDEECGASRQSLGSKRKGECFEKTIAWPVV
jgi:hypothetical protein